MNDNRQHRAPSGQRGADARRREVLSAIFVVILAAVGLLAVVTAGGDNGPGEAAGSLGAGIAGNDEATALEQDTGQPAAGEAVPDLDIVNPAAEVIVEQPMAADCVIADELGPGDKGTDVRCLQQALIRAGYLDSEITGEYGPATFAAVEAVQKERDLFVDGVAGRETAISVDVWPDEREFVVRTPPPPPGAVDELGMALSSVSSTGADAPPLPANSGSGRRVVYERAGQRAWAVAEDGDIVRSWLVTGSKYSNELPGTHTVYSRSEESTAWNGRAILPLMIRYLKTDIGAIGFHGIPIHVEDGSPYQTEAELGTRMSGGCQRQANPDAAFLWQFADVGTTVVVV
ncbi:MAG: murein L,D-transpeptidase [Acidimicrobiia bacterium]|nr:murein L,D-transpeptidase [Acidimicrobiia bacterium]